MADRNYYEVLGVSSTADDAEIKRAYRRLALAFHPDRNPGDKKAEAKFKEANTAFQTLGDEEKRNAYDSFGGPSARSGAAASRAEAPQEERTRNERESRLRNGALNGTAASLFAGAGAAGIAVAALRQVPMGMPVFMGAVFMGAAALFNRLSRRDMSPYKMKFGFFKEAFAIGAVAGAVLATSYAPAPEARTRPAPVEPAP